MDNYKSLFDKKQYDLVVKLTRSSSNPEDLFYCLSALLSQNKIEDALKLIDDKREILETRLPTLMRTHIELLCLAGRFEEANKTIKYYENLPYHSQEAEETLKELQSIVEHYLVERFKSNHKSEDELISNLLSDDPAVVLGALDSLREYDITPYYLYLSKILFSFPKQSIRSFALLLLVQKQVNKVFKYNSRGKIIEVNPSLLHPPFIGEDFMNVAGRMQIEYKDVSLSENALQILSSYLIYIYPETVDFDNPLLLEALHIIAAKYLKIDYDSPIELECQELIKEIEEALRNM